MSSSGTKTPSRASRDDKVALNNISLTALMRHRAHDQFASVRAGHGPIPTGQRTSRERPNTKAIDANPANFSSNAHGPKVTPSLRTKSSTVNLKIDKEAETSATGAPRTLRARPSNMNIRATGQSLTSKPINVPVENGHNGKEPLAQNVLKIPQIDFARSSNKQQRVNNSPVLSAMLRSRLPQKSITNGLGTSPRTTQLHAQPQTNSGFEGGGMKVKGSSTNTTSSVKPSNRPAPASNPNVRVKSSQVIRTPIIKQAIAKSAPSGFSPAPPLVRGSAVTQGSATTLFRPVTIKSASVNYQKY